MKRFLSMFLVLTMLVLALPVLAEPATLAVTPPDMTAANAVAAAAAAGLSAEQKTLNIFTWTYYVPDEVVAAFEEATGIRVNYTAMLGNEDVLPKLSTSGSQYDLIVCSDYIQADLIKQNLLTAIDREKLPNYANINPAYQNQYFDPENGFTIPYTNTVPLIVYDPEKVDFEVTGYNDLWNEAFRDNLAVVSEWRGVIGMVQKKLGYSYNDEDPAHIAEIGEALKALKPNITIMTDDTPHYALIYGDAIAGFMYGSQIVEARKMLPQLKVVYPAEGLGFGIDCLVLSRDMPHPEAAYIFLNYLLDGAVSAYTSELINYGNCNLAAPAFMSASFLANDTVNIPAEKVATAEMMKPLPTEALDLYDQIWRAFKG